jgi:GNAT superfamily N-acetyltransferase
MSPNDLPPPLTDVSTEGLRRAIEADQIASRLYCADLPLEVHDEPDAAWAVASFGDLFRSVVVRAAFDQASADERIDEILATYDRVGNPVAWWLAPTHTPDDLVERLSHRGFQEVGESAGMALDLSTLAAPTKPTASDQSIDGFTIEPVRDAGTAREFVEVVREDRPEGVPPYSPESVEANVEVIAWRVARRTIPGYFIGRLNGRAVATAKLSVVGGTAGIYSVVTLAEARGMGIGTQMTLAALEAGRKAGYRIATLQSSPMGHRIYERLGFRELVPYRILIRRPSQTPRRPPDGAARIVPHPT